MRMPPHDFQPPTGMTIHNGQPVRGDHAATVDEWAMWMVSAEGGHPFLPTLLTAGVDTVGSGRNGWRSNDTDWGDNPTVTIPTLVPPFCKYLQVGVVATGTGEIRITGPNQAAYVLLKVQGLKGNTFDDAVAVWCDPPGPTGADTNHPIIVSGAQGYSAPSLQDLVVQWRTTKSSHDLEILSFMIRPWPQPHGTVLSGLSAPGGGAGLDP